ncbi:MAG: thiamine biosynthesis protein ThiF [Campylobacterota bacterium]|nr:thiamine biosynthesis protein ThiF [Campylobacterota bacterium]
MIAGSKISCIGIVGDGCGGGREFIIEDGVLFAHDPDTKEDIILLENIHMPRTIGKKGCLITIECKDKRIEFDLSSQIIP